MRSRENIHVIYVLLFLEAAFFVFQTQDPERYAEMFAFVPAAVLSGEVWRLLTYQFIHGGALSFFFSVLILYIMGNNLEEEWGTFDFVAFWVLSFLGSAAVGFALGSPLFGSFFLSYSLLFAYAATYPEMTFYIFFVLPVKVKWLAWIALVILGFGILMRSPTSLAAAGGAGASMLWFWMRHGRYATGRIAPRLRRAKPLTHVSPAVAASEEKRAEANLAMFGELQRTLESGDRSAIEATLARLDREKTPNVNICPPADFKPLAEDRFCAKCEGFAECSARLIRASTAGESDDRQASGRG
ncbi:MAG TPA: rhomboid family intramembrane serine protease [Thermoanaerobaculia bacterium]|nr:rhomboid family intramembrane serine protease [Thermoanaerobaculia bacterium]